MYKNVDVENTKEQIFPRGHKNKKMKIILYLNYYIWPFGEVQLDNIIDIFIKLIIMSHRLLISIIIFQNILILLKNDWYPFII